MEASLLIEKKRIGKDKKLDAELNSFILFLESIHKLEFEISDYPESDYLLKEKIISRQPDKYKVENYTALALKLFEYYKQIFKFKQSKNLQKDIEFLDQIKKNFTQDHFFHYYFNVEKELWKIIVYEKNKKYKTDFGNFIKTLFESKHEKTFSFLEAYSQLLPVLVISNQSIYDNSIVLLNITKDDTATWNVHRSEVLIGIRNWASQHTTRGKELLHFSYTNSDDNAEIISALITGLYDELGFKFYIDEIEGYVNSKTSLFGIFTGLAIIRTITDNEANLFIKLFDLNKKDENLLIPLVRMLLSVVKSKDSFNEKEKFAQKIFARLNELFTSNHQETNRYILNEISFLNNYIPEKTDLILNLISQQYFSNDLYIQGISQVFWYLNEIDSLKKVLLALAAIRPFKNTAKHFSSSFHHFDAVELDKMIIELLLDDKAYIRHLGLTVFDCQSQDSGYLFKNDILELKPLEQYKLWVAVCRNLKEPKHFLPCLLPLLQSKSEIVKESFICKLEEYTEDYGGHIIQLLEDKIGISVPQEIFDRIKSYSDNFFATNLDEKNKILELNPYYTHNKLFVEFSSMYRRDFSKKINKGGEEKSFLRQLATTIQLGKGGGWRIGDREEISKLGSYGLSFALPRSYFIFPNRYDIEKGVEMREDWQEDDFNLIKEFISNEQQ